MDLRKKLLWIINMLQNIIADNQINRVALNGPRVTLYKMKLINKWIGLSMLINIDSDDFTGFSL